MTKRKGETTEKYIERWRKEYKKLKPVYSKHINGTIRFSSEGFDHLIYKRSNGQSRRRSLKVIQDRLPYILHIKAVILNGPILMTPRVIKKKIYGSEREIVFHSFLNKISTKQGYITIRVVVRKIGDKGDFIFQSVMKTRINKNQKNAQ